MTNYSIPEISAEAICNCIEALDKKSGTLKYLAKFLNRTETYVRRAVNLGCQLNLFKSKDNFFHNTTHCSSFLKRVNGDPAIVFREAVLNYKPYVQFIRFVLEKNSPQESIRKIKAIYDMKNEDKVILKTLNNFSKFLNIELVPEKLEKLLDEETKYENINRILSSIKNKFQAQLIISDKLDSLCFNYLTNPERILLVDSFLKVETNPKNSIDDAAGAFESFIRRVGKEKNVDLTNANGIDEIGQILSSKKNKIILTEHGKMCSFIAAFRNPSTHKINKYSLEHWEINKDSCLELILLILTSMRSIYLYTFYGKHVL